MSKPKPAPAPVQLPTRFADSEELCRVISQASNGVCLLSFSCGKDSVHGDSVVWVRRNGEIERTTPAALETVIRAEVSVELPSGRAFYRPTEPIEILTASSENQREAAPVFRPIAYLMAHETSEPLYEFVLAGGRTVRVTGDHSVMVSTRKNTHLAGVAVAPVLARDVCLGDRMLSMADCEFETPEQSHLEDWFLRLCGLWIADGCYAADRKIVISCGGNPETVAFLRRITRTLAAVDRSRAVFFVERVKHGTQEAAVAEVAQQLGTSRSTVLNGIYRSQVRTHEHIRAKVTARGDVWLCDKGLVSRMQRLGFIGGSHTKRVPPWVFTLSRRQIGIFLAGYLDGDGCSQRGGFVASSVSRKLMEDMAALLQRLGVPCAVATNRQRVGGFSKGVSENTRLSVTGARAHDQLKKWCPTWKPLTGKIGSGPPVYPFRSHAVMEIRRIPSARVFDFEVEGQHTFIADGVLVHNSCASWLQLRRHFTRIVPYYLYRVPGLQFVEDRIRYFEDFFQARIIQLPHPSTYRMLNNCVFQPPQNRRAIEEANLPSFSYDDINQIIREDLNLDPRTYCASGVRSSDSLARRTKVKTHGPVNHARLAFYPVYDWNKDRLIEELASSGVRLPIDYKLFGVSFDGINEQFLGPIREHFPADYRRILEFFPLAEIELARAAYREGRRYVA